MVAEPVEAMWLDASICRNKLESREHIRENAEALAQANGVKIELARFGLPGSEIAS